MEDQNRLAAATKTVNARLGFFIHLAAFVLVNVGLAIINLTVSPGRLWFQWPLLGWGAGLGLHALGVFLVPRWSALRARMITREMNKPLPKL